MQETGKILIASVSLSQYLANVQQAIQFNVLPNQWIVAELSNFQRRNGHVYLELSENSEKGQTLASCRAMIWASQVFTIEQKFSQVTGQSLANGQKLLLNVSASFHPQYGFSLQVNDIDPSYTLGDIEKVLNDIRLALVSEGIWEKNKQRKLPNDFLSVAVIAPESAAGLGDFQAEANRLSTAGVCQFTYFHATFQGDKVELSFQKAFSQVQQNAHQYDVLIIIRGGGAKLDLHHLNKYILAKSICENSLPVITGIGHERDLTILDEVAHSKFDTPSKVIHFIEQSIYRKVKQAQQNWQWIVQSSQRAITEQKHRLEQMSGVIEQSSRNQLTIQKQDILANYQRLIPYVQQKIQRERSSLMKGFEYIQAQTLQKIALEQNSLRYLQHSLEQQAQRQIQQSKERIDGYLRFVLSSGKDIQLSRGFGVIRQAGQTLTHSKNINLEQQISIEMQDGILSAQPLKVELKCEKKGQHE